MKQALVVGIAMLFFVGVSVAPAYAKETVLASKSGAVTKQESLPDLRYRLVKEAIEEGKKHPCVQKAFDAGREDFNAAVRSMIKDGVMTIMVVTQENC